MVVDPDNSGSFLNDGYPVIYYSAALPAGDNIFYSRLQWRGAVAGRLSEHSNELAFMDVNGIDLIDAFGTSDEMPDINNLISRTADGLGWVTSHLVITDRVPFYSPCDFTARKVTYDRQLYKDGGYESWYFPLDVSASQLPEDYNFEIYGGQDLASNTVSFVPLSSDVTELSANTPYLLKYAGEERWSSASNVRLQWENIVWPASEALSHADITSETGFYGSLLGQTAEKGNGSLYTIATHGESLSSLAVGKTLTPFRCYFYHVGVGAARISVVHRGVNSIDAVTTEANASACSSVYDLQGRPVSENSTEGIFIHNGKTIIKQ